MAPSERPAPRTLAALVHLVIMASVLVMAATAWFLRSSGAMGPAPEDGAGAIRLILLAAGLTVLALGIAARSRLGDSARDSSEDWWRGNFPRALLVWALADSTALIGIVAFIITGDLFTLAVLGGAGLLLLLLSAPSRLGPV
jgi:hypothetical protein